MQMLSDDDRNIREMSPEELARAWDLWFDLAQTTNASDPPYSHGVFATESRVRGAAPRDGDMPQGAWELPAERRVCAALLYRLMSDLSEERWCAGWLHDLEFELWAGLHGTSDLPLTAAESEQLRYLAEHAGGWIVWEDGPRFVPREAWLERVRRRAQAEGPPR